MPDLTPWIGVVGTVVGIVVGAILSEWRDKNESRRRQAAEVESRVRELQRRQIDQARRILVAQLDHVMGLAIGDVQRLADAEKDLPRGAIGFIDLLADEELIRQYASALKEFQLRVGTGLSADEIHRLVWLEIRVIRALNRQEERIVRGEPLLELPQDVLDALLSDETGITAGLQPQAIPPSAVGRLARLYLRHRRGL